MLEETTGQANLFPERRTDAKGTPTSAAINPQPSAPALSAEVGSGPQLGEPTPSRTVSPFANMPLTETCGFCGREVHPPGYVIPDYEELGAFCDQDCADRRFRIYLEETSE